MTTNYTAGASPQVLSSAADAINAMLVMDTSVTDCVTVIDTKSNTPVRVYVVSTGARPDRQLRPKIEAAIANVSKSINVAVIAISNLPLTATGQVDIRLLSKIPVIDEETVASCEQQLQARHPDSHVAVEIVARNFPNSLIHCSDLGIQPIQPVKAADLANHRQAPVPATGLSDAKGNTRQAIIRNAPLKDVNAPRTLPEALLRASSSFATHGVGYIDASEQWFFQSHANLYEDAQHILAALQNQGITAGHKVVLQFTSNTDFIPAFWACIIGGIIPVPIASPPTYSDLSNNTLRNLVDTWSLLDSPAILTSGASDRHIARMFQKLDLSGLRTLTVETLRASAQNENPVFHAADPEDLAMLLFTSGSTGHPKGICYTHRNLVENVAASAAINHVSDADLSLNWLHLDHVGALVRCCIRDIYVGNTQIHAATQLFLHDPLRWLDWIETHRVTFAWAPNFGLSLLNERLRASTPASRDLSFVRSILSVAEPIVPKVAQEFAANMQRFGIGPEKIHAAWGMSETSAAVVFSHDFLARLPSPDYPFTEVGSPVPGLSIRIADDADRIVAEGDTGNVQIAGAMIISRYFANEQATKAAYTSDGWFRTGDLGFLKDGKLTITGRKKDTIIIYGRNISSHEVESVVDTVAGVTKTFTAAIAIRERARDTDQLAVFFHTDLEQAPEQRLLLECIMERVVTEIGIRPAYVIAVDRESIPKSSAGKILRSRLRDSFLEGNFDEHIKQSDLLLENERTFPGWFLKRNWRQKQAPPKWQLPDRSGITIIFQDSLGLAQALQAGLESRGHNCLLVRPGDTFREEETDEFVIDPGEADHYRRLIERVRKDHHSIRSILHLWAYTAHQEQVAPDALDNALDLWFFSLAFLAKALFEQLDLEAALPIHVCATDAQPVSAEDYLCCEKGLALGLVQTIPQEQPFLDWRHYDFADIDVQETADLIMNELAGMARDREIAYRKGLKFVPVLEELTSSDFSGSDDSALHIQPGGLYLITGGFGEIGLEIAQTLAEDKDARLLLVGRTPLPLHPPAALSLDETCPGDTRFAKKLYRYQTLKASHPYIEYRAVDICDACALMDAVEDLESSWQTSLSGVFHLARVTDDTLIHEQTRDGLLHTLKPKVQGTLSVGRLLNTRPDAFFVGFSSVSSTLGTYRMAAYASANRYIDNFCVQLRNSQGRAARSLAWSIWEEVGAERSYQMRDLSLQRGLFTLPTDKGIAALFAAMRCRDTGVIIGLDPGNRYIRQFMTGPPEAINELSASISFAETAFPGRRADSSSIQDRLGNTVVCQLADTEAVRSKQLSSAERLSSLSPELVQYRAELEKTLTAIWEELLQVDCVEPEDNFFDLGGHSILAAQFVVELARQTDEHIELSTLFEHPILRDLVDNLVIRQSGASQHADHQSSSRAQLSILITQYYQTLRLTLQQQFPQVLEHSPIEHYVEQIRKLPALAGYVQIGTSCNRTMEAIRKMAGDDLEPLYNRLAMVHAMQCSLEAFDQLEYPEDIEDLFVGWFQDVLEGTSWTEDDFFRLDHDPFLKDMAVCTGRMIPVGGAWVIELSGISRRIFFSGSPYQQLARCLFLSSRVRAFKPFYQIHMALRFADRFNEKEREASYVRIAAMLRANPGVKGLIGSSWYLDPALKDISPELSYLQDLPKNNGALIFPLNTPTGTAKGALVGSARRTQLYKEGRYTPKNAFIIWPRTVLLGWTENQAVNKSGRRQVSCSPQVAKRRT